MGVVRNLLISGGIKVLSAVLDKMDSDSKSKKGAPSRDDQKDSASPDAGGRSSTDRERAAQSKTSRKKCRCKRCDAEILDGVQIDGKTVCSDCAKIIRAEKKLGYSHGPGFGRLSKRTCARCGIDLLMLDEKVIYKMDGKEYCDICSGKIKKEIARSSEVTDEIFKYMKGKIPGTVPPMATHAVLPNNGLDEAGYLILSPENNNENRINIYVNDGIILSFANCQVCYKFNLMDAERSDFYNDLNALIDNKKCAVCACDSDKPEDNWRYSALLNEERLTEEYLYDKFVKNYKFGTNLMIVCSFWDASKDRKFMFATDMSEIIEDSFYPLIKKCSPCVLDYCLMKNKQSYKGVSSHLAAVLFAMRKFCFDYSCKMNIEEAQSEKMDAAEFLAMPSGDWQQASDDEIYYRSDRIGEQLRYWYAFLEPPSGGGPIMRNGHVIEEGLTAEKFHEINRTLFPNGAESLEVYGWSTDWADYFDEGNEWWGTGCWSIYDRSLDRYVVIMASVTD